VGVGDPFGMPVAHIAAAGMGGIRTTGDLVAWMQLHGKLKIAAAKRSVAAKLGVTQEALTDEVVMRRLREELGIGTITSLAGGPKGIRAKLKVAELLGIPINSVALFKRQVGLG
jgi:dimethylamine--corrinoid protein Co-methyltransferase